MVKNQAGVIDRRSFLGAAALGAAAVAGLVGCSNPSPSGEDPSDEENMPGSTEPENVAETLDVDIVVLGAGAAGLACAVQAAEDGLRTLVLEKGSAVGGNCAGTEGVFAIGTRFQKEKGIELDPVFIIQQEMVAGQYRPDGAMWLKFIKSSGENFTWCEEHGVKFTGVMESPLYGSVGHTFETNGSVGYVTPMAAAAEAAGAEFRLRTAGTSLIVEDGVVKGCFAQDADGNFIRVNAKATVLATGGIGCNAELLKGQGWTTAQLENMILVGAPQIVGDGYLMAMEVGAKDFLPNASTQVFNGIVALGADTTVPLDSPLNSAIGLAANPTCVWINQDGVRHKNESLSFTYNMAASGAALMCNKANYAFFDEPLLMSCVAGEEDQKALENALSGTWDKSLYKADTIEELANHFGIDPAALKATVEEYNSYCDAGADPDFGKDPMWLQAFRTPPYYLAKLEPMLVAVDGGVTTNIKAEAVDDELDTIPGLYAAGLDGAMLWRNVYTQNIGGTMMGNNIHTGRVAAQSAKAYIESLA